MKISSVASHTFRFFLLTSSQEPIFTRVQYFLPIVVLCGIHREKTLKITDTFFLSFFLAQSPFKKYLGFLFFLYL